MVKRRLIVDEATADADLPYEETRLARRAGPARRRLAGLLLLGAGALVVEAVLERSFGWGFGALAVGLTAWGIRRGRLGALLAAALVAILAFALPIRWYFLGPASIPDLLTMALAVLWGATMMPDVLLLIRDAELQHAYGRWARRDA